MTLSRMLARELLRQCLRLIDGRRTDVVIGGADRPYLLRWWLLPRNPVFNIYLHRFIRSDDDRALHDHMYVNLSILLDGAYTEHTIKAGGVNVRKLYRAGDVKFRWPWQAHRIELTDGFCWTLFITGPRIRNWYFHCENAGMVPWQEFVAADDSGSIGRGCGEA